jgi:acyl-CoA dehydrogenase
LQQVLVQEQCGRATNGLAWAMHTAPQWWADVATDYQRGRWLLPAVRDEKHEAYAITEEFAGSDVSGLQSTARRDGDEYGIDGVKWHVTSYNLADYLFVQARLVGGEYHGEHVLLVVDLPWPGVEIVADGSAAAVAGNARLALVGGGRRSLVRRRSARRRNERTGRTGELRS